MTLGPLMIDIEGETLTPEDRDVLRHPLVGAVILFARNYTSRTQVRELVNEIHSLREGHEHLPPVLICVDQEGGRVQRFKAEFTALPPLRWLGHLYDEDPQFAREMSMRAARLMATEVLDTGVDFSFAPVLDIDFGLSEIIGDRAFHSNPDVVAQLGLAYMQGMRQVGMAAVAKHFPGHGGVTADSHHALPVDNRSYTELLDDIRPYRSLVDDGLCGVMMAHIRYPEVEQQIACLSPHWMNTVLRQELGFQGVIFSDDLCMAGASEAGTVADRVTIALRSGADMALICNDRPSVAPALAALEGYQQPVSHARLAAMRVNREHYLSAPYQSDDWQRDLELIAAAREKRPVLELDGNGE